MEQARNRHSIDMTTGAILPKLLMTALPLIASGVLQLFFNAADVIVVGRFASEHSLAAVGTTSALINLITNLFIGLSIGANALASFYYGARDNENLSRAVHNSILLSVIGGAGLTFIGIVFAPTFLRWMQAPEKRLVLRSFICESTSREAYRFCSLTSAAPCFAQRGHETSIVLLDFCGRRQRCVEFNLAVLVFKMDVGGVALATIIAQALAACSLSAVCVKRRTRSMDLHKLRLDRDRRRDPAHGRARRLRDHLLAFERGDSVVDNGFGPTAMAGSAALRTSKGSCGSPCTRFLRRR